MNDINPNNETIPVLQICSSIASQVVRQQLLNPTSCWQDREHWHPAENESSSMYCSVLIWGSGAMEGVTIADQVGCSGQNVNRRIAITHSFKEYPQQQVYMRSIQEKANRRNLSARTPTSL